MMDANDRWWEQWDKDGIAQHIEDIWTKKDILGFENLHRQNLVKLVSTYYKLDMKKILEVGSGTGLIYQLMIEKLFDKSQYVGIDTSHEMLKIAHSKFPDGNFEWGNAFDIDYKEKYFDLVFSFEVMVHLPEMDTPVAEILRVTNQVAIFTVWVADEEKIFFTKKGDAEFIHHYYANNKVLRIIHRAIENRPHRVEIRPLSDHTWAYIVLFDRWDSDQFIPFPNFLTNFLSSAQKIQLQNLQEISELQENITGSGLELADAHKKIIILEQNQKALQQKLVKRLKEVEAKQKELNELKRRVFVTEKKLLITQQDLSESRQILNAFRQDRVALIKEKKSSNAKNIINLIRLVRASESLENQISPAFQQLRDDSYLYNSSLKNYLLQPSSYINNIEFLPYQIKFNRANLSAILIAPILEIPSASGEIGIEIVSPQNEIVRQTLLPLKNINPVIPVKFSFLDIAETNTGTWGLRIFLKNADVPVQIFEWRRFSILSKGFIKRKPFLGFSFTTQN